MTVNEYFLEAIRLKYLSDMLFIETMFNVSLSNNKYIKKTEDGIYVFIDGNMVPVEASDKVFDFYKVIKLPKGVLNNDKEITTTMGIALLNYILILVPFKDKIEWLGENVSVGKLHNIIIDGMGDKFTSEDISRLSIAATFLSQLDAMVIIPATEKTIIVPPGVKKEKERLIKELEKKYGKDPLKKEVAILEFEKGLIEFYKNFLKDDPTYGVTTKGKAINIIGKKRFLTIGYEGGFESGSEVVITESLSDGHPLDPDKLSTLFNQGRSGSYFRGVETQDSGHVANNLLLATQALSNKVDDCGTTKYITVPVRDDNYDDLVGFRLFGTNEVLSKGKLKGLIGKSIDIRSPMQCIAPGDNYCKMCLTEPASYYKNSASTLAIGAGGGFLNGKLKKTHGVDTLLKTVGKKDLFM